MITPAFDEAVPAAVWVLARRAEGDGGTRQDGGDGDRPGPGKVEGLRGTLGPGEQLVVAAEARFPLEQLTRG